VIETRLLQPVTPTDLVTVTRLHDDVEAVDGHPSLGEAVWRDLDQPLEAVSAGVLATDDGRAVGFAYVYRSDSFSPPHWAAGVVVHPEVRGSTGVEVALLDHAVAHVAAEAGGLVVLWSSNPISATTRLPRSPVSATNGISSRSASRFRSPRNRRGHPASRCGPSCPDRTTARG